MATSGNQQNNSSIKGSDFLYELVCKPCRLDDLSKPAFGYCSDCDEHLCSMCYVNHKKSRPSRHHTLLDSCSMPQTQTLDDTDTTVDEGPSVMNGDILREIIARAQSIEVKCDSVKNGITQKTYETIASLKRSVSDLKKYRSDITRKLKSQENEIIKTISELTIEKNDIVKITGTKCDVMKADTQLQKDTLTQMKKSKRPNRLLIEIQQTREILDEYEVSLQSMESQHNHSEYQFIPNTAIQTILDAENTLGTISLKQKIIPPTPLNISQQRTQHTVIEPKRQQVPLPSTSSNHVQQPPRQQQTGIKPKNKDEILVKTREDYSGCRITGMTEITPGTLVIADNSNRSIKLVDVRSKFVTSRLKLEQPPCDITTISTTEVAVTMPDQRCIQFVTVSNNLKKSRWINTNGDCHGICYHQDKLIVTFSDPGKLEILDMKGKVIKSITTDTTGKDRFFPSYSRIFSEMFTYPYYAYVQATDKSIYMTHQGNYNRLSGSRNNYIIMVDYHGNVISRYDDMDPQGMVVLNDNSLLVCSLREHKVYQLTEDVKKCTAISQDVEVPQAICVNQQHNKVYISRYDRDNYSAEAEVINNTIIVWNI